MSSVNGLAGAGDLRILEYSATRRFILISTDSDVERLIRSVPGARVVVLRSRDDPTVLAAQAIRRNAIRIAVLQDQRIV